MTLLEKIAEFKTNPEKLDLLLEIESEAIALATLKQAQDQKIDLLQNANLRLLNAQPVEQPKEKQEEKNDLPDLKEVMQQMGNALLESEK